VGAPGGASGNFQSRVSTISLHGCGTSGGDSLRDLTEEEEEEEEEEDEEEEEVVVVVVVQYLKCV
jgi:hypothetical protein